VIAISLNFTIHALERVFQDAAASEDREAIGCRFPEGLA
jgi:hypothetical protein